MNAELHRGICQGEREPVHTGEWHCQASPRGLDQMWEAGMVEPEAECTFYKCIKQSEMCNVAFPNHKNTLDVCMTQHILL